ncbi:hypothetical protein [Bifidobacterium sp. ESL0790]|uniref:hypothetical protein n=1 Tax=Bifidobacterium sp. ESL0790 TaxID=2983233 RepID=UPI0023F7B76A|nr:hypothetical protein [Bifidobacterium sp. ESL0790]WEV72155.1 hypothetical protein OZY47_06860 [Bifidobacterium sp. ESL0790]
MYDGGLHVTIGGYRLWGRDGNGCEWLANNVTNLWNGAGTTHEHSVKVRSDGWFANRSSRLGRTFSIEGSVVAPTYQAFLASRDLLLAAIPLSQGEMVHDLFGVPRLFLVRQDSGEILFTSKGELAWDFSIPLVSLTPYSFDAGSGVSGSTGLPSTTGGLTYPYTFGGSGTHYGFLEHTVSGQVSLTNTGSAPTPVHMRVDGPVSGPMITHQPSGRILALDVALGVGHYAEFNSLDRQVLIDGTDPARGKVIRRGWSEALPGENEWQFSADHYDPGARLSIDFRSAYL